MSLYCVTELYGSELLEQIHSLGLQTTVAWIGDHLNSVVREHLSQNLPVLFFNWVPNILTSGDEFSRLHFPLCDGGLSHAGCDFEVHQLTKIMWSRLHTHIPEAHHLVSQLNFSTADLQSLLLSYSHLVNTVRLTDEVDYLEQAACNWVHDNEEVWSEWLPEMSSSKQMIYLGGLFPMDGPFWRQRGIVPGK